MIALKKIERSDRDRLWNLFQKYLYEMTNYYDMDMDALGNFQYKYFDSYFEDVKREAVFIYDDSALVGFAMINDYSCLGNHIDHAIAEFTIFPQHRRRNLGMKAIREIFARYPGRWEIKYSNKNKAAEVLWRKAAMKYNPILSLHDGTESVLSFIVS